MEKTEKIDRLKQTEDIYNELLSDIDKVVDKAQERVKEMDSIEIEV